MITWLRSLSRVQLAWLLAGLMALWLLSGLIFPSDRSEEDTQTQETEPFAVRGMVTAAQDVSRYIVLYGRSEANRMVELYSELEGRVTEVNATEGEVIERSAPIVTLEVKDREARLNKADARVKQRRIDYQAAQKLAKQGFISNIQLAEKKALLEEANADLELARTLVSQLSVRAPFDGTVDRIEVELGELVKANQTLVARVVDNHPIVIHGQVTEFDFSDIRAGLPADIQLADGRSLTGEVRYVSVVAEPATHTFRIEVEVPNPDRTVPVGVTAELRIPVERMRAHLLPKSSLVLDEKGQLGIKTVDAASIVVFYPVEIIRDTGNGIWLTGLPEQATVITLGGPYVSDGEKVALTLSDIDAARLPSEEEMSADNGQQEETAP